MRARRRCPNLAIISRNSTPKLGQQYNDDAVGQTKDGKLEEHFWQFDTTACVLPAVDKAFNLFQFYLQLLIIFIQLHKIVCAVRSSPQQKQSWLNQLESSLCRNDGAESADHQQALMLILDVRTRWSSTHQMLRELFLVTSGI